MEQISLENRRELENKELLSKKTHAIYDYEFIKALKQIPWSEWLDQANPFRCRDEYTEKYYEWIHTSRLNIVTGLDQFRQKHLINGTTQTFDEAYFKYAHKRLRFFRGEYAYHRRIVKNWAFIEDAPLDKNDFVIVSAPFCSTGDVHPQMNPLLESAYELQIPVIVDCAYFGTCEQVNLDLSHPSIESVSFSLTKGLGLGDIRSGVRFSNISDQNPINQQHDYNHSILAAARIGLFMMSRFSPDFIPTKYSLAQKQICKELGFTPTKCMHIALAPAEAQWDDYKIDGLYHRVGVRNIVKARYRKEI